MVSAIGKWHISGFPAGSLQKKSACSSAQMHCNIYAITLCGLWYDLSSLSFLIALIISFLPEFTHSLRHFYFTSCPVRFCYIFWPLSPFLLFSPFSLILLASRWQTAANHKMVDQRLFPAHPNLRWLGRHLGSRLYPTFF